MAEGFVVRNRTRGTLLSDHTRLAASFTGRLLGLLFQPPLTAGQGLWLERCHGVHTWFMGYSIDVIYLSAEGRVIAVWEEVPPYRFLPVYRDCTAVLELPTRRIASTMTRVGDLIWSEGRGTGDGQIE